jgi:hypothetical protein
MSEYRIVKRFSEDVAQVECITDSGMIQYWLVEALPGGFDNYEPGQQYQDLESMHFMNAISKRGSILSFLKEV